jgi:hypothetical protein
MELLRFIMRFFGGYIKGLDSFLSATTLSPVSPSPYQGEGGFLERGVSPLLDTPFISDSSIALSWVGFTKLNSTLYNPYLLGVG